MDTCSKDRGSSYVAVWVHRGRTLGYVQICHRNGWMHLTTITIFHEVYVSPPPLHRSFLGWKLLPSSIWFHMPLFWRYSSQLLKPFSLPSYLTRLGELVMPVLSEPPRLPTKTSFTAQSLKLPKAVFAFPRSVPQQKELAQVFHSFQEVGNFLKGTTSKNTGPVFSCTVLMGHRWSRRI